MKYNNLVEHINAEYLGHDGLIVDLKPNATDYEDNPNYFTCIYHLLCNILGTPDNKHEQLYTLWIHNCRVNDFGKKIEGLYHRYPFMPRESNVQRKISQDEMIGLASYRDYLAQEILEYGKSNFYSWDNRCPNEFTFRGMQLRSLELVPYLRERAGYGQSLITALAWAIRAIAVTKSDYGWTNGKLKLWVTSIHMRNSDSWIVRKACEYFLNYMTKTYGNLGNFMGIYFGKEHPFSIWTLGRPF